MPDVTLHRADDQRIIFRSRRPERPPERRALDRIAHRGARAVRLEIPRRKHAQPGFGVGVSDEGLLGCRRGHGDSRCVAVLVASRRADDGLDGVAVAQSVGQTLKDEDAEAFASGVAVCAVVEGEAFGGRGEHVHRCQGVHHVRGEDQVGACHYALHGTEGMQGQRIVDLGFVGSGIRDWLRRSRSANPRKDVEDRGEE